MIERETAIKTAANRRIETPETRRILDFAEGDYVQIIGKGIATGKVGVIIGIRLITFTKDNGADIAYTVKLSDTKSVEVCGGRLRFLRHSEDKQEPPKNGKI